MDGVKGVKYVVMERNLTTGSEHTCSVYVPYC